MHDLSCSDHNPWNQYSFSAPEPKHIVMDNLITIVILYMCWPQFLQSSICPVLQSHNAPLLKSLSKSQLSLSWSESWNPAFVQYSKGIAFVCWHPYQNHHSVCPDQNLWNPALGQSLKPIAYPSDQPYTNHNFLCPDQNPWIPAFSQCFRTITFPYWNHHQKCVFLWIDQNPWKTAFVQYSTTIAFPYSNP